MIENIPVSESIFFSNGEIIYLFPTFKSMDMAKVPPPNGAVALVHMPSVAAFTS